MHEVVAIPPLGSNGQLAAHPGPPGPLVCPPVPSDGTSGHLEASQIRFLAATSNPWNSGCGSGSGQRRQAPPAAQQREAAVVQGNLGRPRPAVVRAEHRRAVGAGHPNGHEIAAIQWWQCRRTEGVGRFAYRSVHANGRQRASPVTAPHRPACPARSAPASGAARRTSPVAPARSYLYPAQRSVARVS